MIHETSGVNVTTEASPTNSSFHTFVDGTVWVGLRESYQIFLLLGVTLVLAVTIICSNSIIIAAMFRYKRLRTASNYFLMSLALSDLWTGIFLPICVLLQSTIINWICILPYCVIIILVTASVSSFFFLTYIFLI